MPDVDDPLISLYSFACNGNESALEFLVYYNRYVHAIDDIIDDQLAGKPRSPEFILSTFSQACTLYSHPFYLANLSRLQPIVFLITSGYADSVKWEASDKDGLRTISDVLRNGGNDMIFAVAVICGGYEHLRKLSPILRENSWYGHHDASGKQI